MSEFQSTNDLYGFPQPLTRVFPAPIVAQRVPTTADYKYPIGQTWIDEVGEDAYILTNVAANTATWVVMATNTGGVDTLTGGSGGAISPSAGNINLLGTANQITTTGSGSTITWSLPAAITAPGSLTTTTTLSAGTTITAGTGITATTGNIAASSGNVSASGSVSAGTSITATAGNITATLGNLILNGAAKQVQVHGGAATDFIGETTLVLGTVTVLNTNIASTDRILLSRRSINGSTALGSLTYSISASTSFTITAVDPGTPANTITADISILEYFIVRQV